MPASDDQVLEAVRALCERPYPPSVREVQQAVGNASPSSTHRSLQRLCEQGLIEWEPRLPRTIRMSSKS